MKTELLALAAKLKGELHSHTEAYAYTQYEQGRVDEKRRLLAELEALAGVEGGEVDYVAIANRAQAATGRGIMPSTVKAVLEAAGDTHPTPKPAEAAVLESEELLRLQSLVYVPGAWRCPKCNLRLFSQVLSAYDGGVSPNESPQACANGCGPMWRVTERDDRQDAQRMANDLWEKVRKAEAAGDGAVVSREFVERVSRINPFGSVENADVRDEAAAMLTAAPKAEGGGDGAWLPIETAPRDGTRVILDWDGARVGYYLDNSKASRPWAGWKVPSMEPWPKGQPTRWMPMPATQQQENQP